MEAVFGHHRAQDLGDRLGGFGLQAHRSVNGNQVQSGRDDERVSNINTDDKQKDVMLMKPRYLNKVRFSSLRSREQRVMQSWSSTKG